MCTSTFQEIRNIAAALTRLPRSKFSLSGTPFEFTIVSSTEIIIVNKIEAYVRPFNGSPTYTISLDMLLSAIRTIRTNEIDRRLLAFEEREFGAHKLVAHFNRERAA